MSDENQNQKTLQADSSDVELRPVVHLVLEAKAVNEEEGFNEIRLGNDETGSVAVIRDDVKGFFKRGAKYTVVILEQITPETAAAVVSVNENNQPEHSPEQTEVSDNVGEDNDTAQQNQGAVETGAGVSGEQE